MTSFSKNKNIKPLKKISVVIFGLGRIGMGYDKRLPAPQYVTSHARAVQIHRKFDLVGGYDPNSKKRTEFERNYKRPTFSCAEKMIRECNPEIVIIASPTLKHKNSIEVSLQSKKIRGVLCEKPLSECLTDSLSIVKTCQQNNIRIS